MSRSRKIFILVAMIFLIALGYASFDISRRTTFPGSKSQLKERIKRTYGVSDSTKMDTVKRK